MTTKERLHQLVDQLPEAAEGEVERLLERLTSTPPRPPTTEELGGQFPDLTGGMSTAEYLRKIRGG